MHDPLYIPAGPTDDAMPAAEWKARAAERAADAACTQAHTVRTAARERMHMMAKAIADQLTDTKYRSIDNAIAEALALCPTYVEQRTEWQAADTAYHEAFARWFDAHQEWMRLDDDQP